MESNNKILLSRRRLLPEYQGLFVALFKIPDKVVHKRVIDAINGPPTVACQECATTKNIKVETADSSTQTENEQNTIIATEKPMTSGSDDFFKPKEFCRRRKRVKRVPQVIKQSQHANTGVAKPQRIPLKTKIDPNACLSVVPRQISRQSSVDSLPGLFDFLGNPATDTSLFENLISTYTITTEDVKAQMLHEWDKSTHKSNGFLPIHEAIIDKDIKKLKRQIIVWERRQICLSKLQTDDGDDPLQLAIKQECDVSIINTILDTGISLESIDKFSNNLIHLAVLYSNTKTESLQLLARKMDLNKFRQPNDDGYTPLHIAVREDNYQMCEMLLFEVDQKLSINKVEREEYLTLCGEKSKKYFMGVYSKKCDVLFEKNTEWLPNSGAILKQNILNACDMKRGCTALHYALENKFNHLVYLLLFHLADPTIKNHSGQSAKTYCCEYGNNSKIDRLIGKIELLLSGNNTTNKHLPVP